MTQLFPRGRSKLQIVGSPVVDAYNAGRQRRRDFWEAVRFVLLVSAVAIGVLMIGCASSSDDQSIYPPVIDAPNTTFAPPVAVPSSTPPVSTAATQATRVVDAVTATNTAITGVTASNAKARLPVAVSASGNAVRQAQQLLPLLADAQATSKANDQAVEQLRQDLAFARDMVKAREEQILQREMENHQQREAAAKKAEEREKVLKAEIGKLNDSISAGGRKLARTISASALVIGTALAGVGVVMFLFVHPPTYGIVAFGVGVLVNAMGYAGVYYGREIAIGGCVLGAASIIAAVWVGLKQSRTDNASLVKATEAAIAAGRLKLEDVADIFRAVQTPGARKLVDVEVGTSASRTAQ